MPNELPPQSRGFLPKWQRNPDGWFELWPREPMLASTSEEAKAKFNALLPAVESDERDDEFEIRPYTPPVRPTVVKEIAHPTHVAKALILQHPDGRYESRYLVYAPNGRYFPVTTPSISSDLENEWGLTWVQDKTGHNLVTLADDLASIEEIASTELDTLVTADAEIKRRP